MKDTITVKAGQSLCLDGAAMKGRVVVEPGGAAWIRGTAISGGIECRGAAAVAVCDSKVAGPTTIEDSAGPVVVAASAGCKGNVLSGATVIRRNSGGVTVVGNQVSGNVTVDDNVSTKESVLWAGTRSREGWPALVTRRRR